jgi:NAD(P)H dehydrogenase (quinone)
VIFLNILVVYAYPNHEGLNFAIKEKVLQGISNAHTIKEIDLYKEKFNPVLYFDGEQPRRELCNDTSTKEYREMIEWSELMIFIYPIWWGGTPAILKGFIDRVFVKDFAYRYQGIRPIGLLKGRKAWIINTHDTPALYARLLQQDYGRILSKQILQMCGIKTYKHTSIAYVRGTSSEKLVKALSNITKIASSL